MKERETAKKSREEEEGEKKERQEVRWCAARCLPSLHSLLVSLFVLFVWFKLLSSCWWSIRDDDDASLPVARCRSLVVAGKTSERTASEAERQKSQLKQTHSRGDQATNKKERESECVCSRTCTHGHTPLCQSVLRVGLVFLVVRRRPPDSPDQDFGTLGRKSLLLSCVCVCVQVMMGRQMQVHTSLHSIRGFVCNS